MSSSGSDRPQLRRAGDRYDDSGAQMPHGMGDQTGYGMGDQAGYGMGDQAGYGMGDQAGYGMGDQAGYGMGDQAGYGMGDQGGDSDMTSQAGEEAPEAGSESTGGEIEMMDPPSMTFPRYAEQMLSLVNQFRAMGGQCGSDYFAPTDPLVLNEMLNTASLKHAQDMANQNYFDHASLDGRTPWDRMEAEGYFGSAYGENIAAGRATSNETFVQWRDSPGHCSNMLSPNFTELGVGYYANPNTPYTHYWVQNFGRR
jgi:uncharacterized protein YkwD